MRQFFFFSGLKPNKLKYGIARIGSLKEASMALCRTECIDSTTMKTMKISWNTLLKLKEFLTCGEWEILSFKLKREIYNFRLSKFIHLPLASVILKATISELNKIQIEFIWFSGTPAHHFVQQLWKYMNCSKNFKDQNHFYRHS